MSDRPRVAFKVMADDEWAAMQTAGAYAGSAVDLADGYVHMSSAEQVSETIRKHYRGRLGLVKLTVDLAALGEALMWEPSRGGALFPHLYAPLPVSAVMAVERFDVADDGSAIPASET